MEDLVRRYCSRRDAQGNVHTLAEDIRTSSLEAWLPDDLEKHVQMDRARLNSCTLERGDQNVLRTQRPCERENETEKSITSRRRRPNGHWCLRQGQEQGYG